MKWNHKFDTLVLEYLRVIFIWNKREYDNNNEYNNPVEISCVKLQSKNGVEKQELAK